MLFRSNLRDALDNLRSKGDISIADILRAGLGLISPSIEEAYNNGAGSALAEVYPLVCDECQDVVMGFFSQQQKT